MTAEIRDRLAGRGIAPALCLLPGGRLASGSDDRTIRIWDTCVDREITRLEIDGPVASLAQLGFGRLVAGDNFGRLHWLEVVD
jgi:WD40 repeat protein